MTEPQPTRSGPGGVSWRAVAIGFALALAWAGYLAVFGPSGGEGGLEPPRLGGGSATAGPVDVAWTLSDLDGKPVEFASFRGRPILLNLWATWCPPCVAEMPSIAKLAADPRMKDVAVVCVSVDGSRQAPRRYAEGKGWAMTMLHATGVPDPFLTDGIPATFIIDPSGRVVASEMGAARWDDPSVFDYFARWSAPAK
ncbi:redoxin family protein [Tundrisphaera sp. TA3]|uniref:TlpA family protein disulfide reductase n=1 Tax=Tundrisphaera sp. TA3 TaxID=3435775 RepID=UPI003EB73EFB